MERIPTFLGTSEDEVTSKDFMKVYRRATINNSNLNTDEAKISNFQNYLGSDSPAEEWYEATGKALNKWPDFESAFFVQFPTMEKAKKTAVELERELAGLKLRVEDLGKKEKYGGQEVWSHIAFAENALDLARRAKIEKGTSSLWVVRDGLPEVLREKVTENQASWTTFCDVIKAINMGHIRDGVRKHNEKVAEGARMKADIMNDLKRTRTIVDSPTAPLRTQLRNTVISQPATVRTNTAANTNLFGNTGGGRGNLFAAQNRPPSIARTPSQPRPPPTEADRAALRARLAAYPMQAESAEGIAAYLEQLKDWRATFPGITKPTEHTGFPLRPGGAPAGSAECYKCGKTGHIRPKCNATPEQLIPPLEGSFRAICSAVLGCPNRNAISINLVDDAEADEFAWVFGTAASQGLQGNGEGPSAR